MSGLATSQMAVLAALPGDACFTAGELEGATGLAPDCIRHACRALVERGMLQRRERGCWSATDEGRIAAETGAAIVSGPRGRLTQEKPRTRRASTGRDKVWRAIRTQQKFAIADLMMLTGDVSAHNIKDYVFALAKAGYLARLPSKGRQTRFLLIDDTGPLAPVQRDARKEFFDRNTGETRPMEPGQVPA